MMDKECPVEGNSSEQVLSPASLEIHQRLLKRQLLFRNKTASARTVMAADRRASLLDAKKQRLVLRAVYVESVVERTSRQSIDEGSSKLSLLNESLLAASAARDARLSDLAGRCASHVSRAKDIAQTRRQAQLELASKIVTDLQIRLQEAEARREELLQGRSSPSRKRRLSCSPTRAGDKRAAAITLQRTWLTYTVRRDCRALAEMNVTTDVIARMDFADAALLLQSPAVLDQAVRVLQTLHIATSGDAAVARLFLSGYMVIAHPQDTLNDGNTESEQLLQHRAQSLLCLIECIGRLSGFHFSLYQAVLMEIKARWDAYMMSFEAWKKEDAKMLVDLITAQYVELQSTLDHVKQSAPDVVAQEYEDAIKSNQLQLLSKLKKLCGAKTVPHLRRALLKARRKARAEAADNQASASQPVLPSNREIIHELRHDQNYTLLKQSEKEGDLHKDEFFGALVMQLEAGNVIEVMLPLISELKQRIRRLLPNKSRFGDQLDTMFDLEIIANQFQKGVYHYFDLIPSVIGILKKLCAPVHDTALDGLFTQYQAAASIPTPQAFCDLLRPLLDLLELMARDNTNFLFDVARPILLQSADKYEQSQFSHDLESGKINLAYTTEWLNCAKSCLEQEATLRDPEHIQLPPSISHASVLRRAFIDLIMDYSTIHADRLPTLAFDQSRIQAYRATFTAITRMASLLLVLRNICSDQHMPTDTWSELKHNLWALITKEDGVSTNDIATCLQSVVTNASLGRLIANLTERIMKGTDAVVRVVSQRLCKYLLDFMSNPKSATSSGSSPAAKLARFGFGEVPEPVIVTFAEQVVQFHWTNCSIYGQWYKS